MAQFAAAGFIEALLGLSTAIMLSERRKRHRLRSGDYLSQTRTFREQDEGTEL